MTLRMVLTMRFWEICACQYAQGICMANRELALALTEGRLLWSL